MGSRLRASAVLGLLLALGAVLWAPAEASAATYCVNFVTVPANCSGTAETNIHNALTAAAGNPGRDTIKIEGGHFYEEAGLVDTGTSPVDIVGVGLPPIVSTPTVGGTVLKVEDQASTVENLQLSISGTADTGLYLEGATATDVDVAGAAALNGAIGVKLERGALRKSTINLAHSVTIGTTGVYAAGEAKVEDSSVVATWAIEFGCCESKATIARVQTLGPVGVRFDQSGHDTIEDSLLLVTGETEGNGTSAGINASESNGKASSFAARNVTIVNKGKSMSTFGVLGSASSGSLAVTVRNSIVRGFGTDLRAEGSGASLASDYSDDSSAVAMTGGSVSRGAHELDVAPGFVNEASDNYRLVPSSPLIDRGDPAVLAAGASTTDFYGAERLVSGLAGCPTIDIGTAEYQPLPLPAPVARATAPSSATSGQTVGFDGSTSCAAAASAPIVSYAWSFDDGASASGPIVQHAFASPGTHTARLTVATAGGQSGSTELSLLVFPPAVQPPPASKPPGPRLLLSTKPIRLTAKGAFSYPVGCPAGEPGPCTGSIAFDTVGKAQLKPGAKKKAVHLGTKSISIVAGATAKIPLKVSQKIRTLLAGKHKLKLRVTATASAGGSLVSTTAATFKLLAPQQQHR